jgi:hypothetical protein
MFKLFCGGAIVKENIEPVQFQKHSKTSLILKVGAQPP